MIGLSESEMMTLKSIWKAGQDVPASYIRATVKEEYGKEWERSTVCTFLSRLEKKGYVSLHRKPSGTGNGYLYHAIYSGQEYAQKYSEELIEDYFDGSVSAFMEEYMKAKKIPAKDRNAIKTMMDAKH